MAASKLMHATSSAYSTKKKGEYAIEDSPEKKQIKPKVKLYPGFQASIEEIRYGKVKQDDETYGLLNKNLIFLVLNT